MNDSTNNNSGLDSIASAVNEAWFFTMNELLTPTQIINTVIPSVPSMLNNYFSVCVE